MTFAESFLRKLSSRLEAAGIRWMITGSTASAHYGEPRQTQDLDVVIDATSQELENLVTALRSDCYVSPEAAREALLERGMFNVVDLESGWKADLIFLPLDPFDQTEFQRRRTVEFFGIRAFLISPEGSILTKLRWAAASGSERQIRDVVSVIRSLGNELDREYLLHWASVLGVRERLLSVLGPPGIAKQD